MISAAKRAATIARTQSIGRSHSSRVKTAPQGEIDFALSDEYSPSVLRIRSSNVSSDGRETSRSHSDYRDRNTPKTRKSHWFSDSLDAQDTEVDRGHRVPCLLAELRRALLEQDAFDEEGIFRKSADQKVLNLIRQRLDGGEDVERVLEGCSVDVLTSLLKEWFRELPGGLWGVDPSATTRGRQISEAKRLEMQEALLNSHGDDLATTMLLNQALQPQHRECLMWLLDLLVEVAEHESISRMGPKQLGAVFAPLLLPNFSDKLAADQQLLHAKQAAILCEKLILAHKNADALKAKPPPPPDYSKTASQMSLTLEPLLHDTEDSFPPQLKRGEKRRSDLLSSDVSG
eukprot:5373626-Pleurochrysis_carterae.AAC.1